MLLGFMFYVSIISFSQMFIITFSENSRCSVPFNWHSTYEKHRVQELVRHNEGETSKADCIREMSS